MASQGKQLTGDALELVALWFKALSEPTRLRLLVALQDGEHSVSELVNLTGSNQANVSRQLHTLSKAGILLRRRSGLNVLYAIQDRKILSLCQQVLATMEQHNLRQARAIGRGAGSFLVSPDPPSPT